MSSGVVLEQVLPALGAGGVGTWAATFVTQWLKNRGDRSAKAVESAVDLEEHRDKLTFDLLAAAREEVRAARTEVAALRPLQMRLAHFEEALDHIAYLLASQSVEERTAAERRANAFLNRMRRLGDASGTLRNEAQITLSELDAAQAREKGSE